MTLKGWAKLYCDGKADKKTLETFKREFINSLVNHELATVCKRRPAALKRPASTSLADSSTKKPTTEEGGEEEEPQVQEKECEDEGEEEEDEGEEEEEEEEQTTEKGQQEQAGQEQALKEEAEEHKDMKPKQSAGKKKPSCPTIPRGFQPQLATEEPPAVSRFGDCSFL